MTLPRITVPYISQQKLRLNRQAKRISVLTAYDYSMAKIFDSAGIDMILVGDSLACVVQGLETTLPVTLDEMIYHCRCVARASQHALLVGDLPFMSYQTSIEKALESAGRIVKEGGVSAVKLEGGVHMADTIRRITQVDIPVIGHVGLTPQSFHKMGGHKVQGRTSVPGAREKVLQDALAVEQAGAFAVVLEGVPAELASEITAKLDIPTIGIGAGVDCDGQVLVSSDMLGFSPDFKPKFLKCYAELEQVISIAVKRYIDEVQQGQFPGVEHSFIESDKIQKVKVAV